MELFYSGKYWRYTPKLTLSIGGSKEKIEITIKRREESPKEETREDYKSIYIARN